MRTPEYGIWRHIAGRTPAYSPRGPSVRSTAAATESGPSRLAGGRAAWEEGEAAAEPKEASCMRILTASIGYVASSAMTALSPGYTNLVTSIAGGAC